MAFLETTAPKKDFFVSYNRADARWAEWIAWTLEEAGQTIVLQAWDFRPGGNFVLEMQKAAVETERTIAVLSPDYLAAEFTQPEWAAAFAHDPTGAKGLLLPIRVRDCAPPGLLSPIFYVDLVGLDEKTAKEKLLAGVNRERAKPKTAPVFPKTAAAPSTKPPPFPGALPPVWNVPHNRNPNFTGRVEMLENIRKNLVSGKATGLTQAIHGLGGVGKTQVAIEYAFRHAADYGIIWWLRAENVATLAGDFAALAQPLALPEKDERDQGIIVAAVRRALGQRSDWLLVFDNAADAETVRDFLPSTPGHVIVTSLNHHWRAVAQPLSVSVMTPGEAADFLRKRSGRAHDPAAPELAKELGYLPLALAQAAAYADKNQISLADYLKLFRQRRTDMLQRGKPADYSDTVATTWNLAFEKVSKESPAAVALLDLCAFLAPDDIPEDMLTENAKLMPAPLSAAAADALAFDEAIGALLRYALVERREKQLSIHRLVQTVIRDRLSDDEKKQWLAATINVVNAAFPFDSDDVRIWPRCTQLLSHAQSVIAWAVETTTEVTGLGRLLNQMGLYFMGRAEYVSAELLYRRALAIAERSLGPDHPNVAASLNNLAQLLQTTNRLTEVEPLMRRALEIEERSLGPDHPNVAIYLNNLAGLLNDTNRLADAEPLMRRALAIDEHRFGSHHPAVATNLSNLAGLLQDTNRLADAESMYRRALAIDEGSYGPEHCSVAIRLNNLAHLLQRTGRLGEAEPLMRRHVHILRKFGEQNGHEHPRMLDAIRNYAGLLQEMKLPADKIERRVRDASGNANWIAGS